MCSLLSLGRLTRANISFRLIGVAKEFEVIRTVQRVIALEDDADTWEVASCVESEWDQLYDNEEDLSELPEKPRQSYSDVSRAKPVTKAVGMGT